MQDDNSTPDVPQDRMDAYTPQADWSLEQVKELARELYIRSPFGVKDTERWKYLVRQAFGFFDNLDWACKEILRERSEMREEYAKAEALEIDAYNKLPSVVPFDKAVRYITSEKLTARARLKFDKVLRYAPRIVPHSYPTRLLSELPAEKEREIDAQCEIWRQNGISRDEVIRLRAIFEGDYPRVIAEQNAKKARKRPKWPKARRLKALEKTKSGT
jgi:hypothetical protein